MKNLRLLILAMVLLGVKQINAQVYNEEDIRQQLDQYIANPKLYYDKIQEVNLKAEKSNANTLKISEEYLALLDKKDSLINLYKKKLAKAATAPASSTAATPAVSSTPVATTKINPSSTTIAPEVKSTVAAKPSVSLASTTPYRVQLAAFYRDDFSKFFGTFNKTIGVEKLDNRNVIEVQGFKDEAEAFEFSQKIKKLGFNGAFVTKYDANGKREEGFATAKNGTKFGIGNETVSTPIEYPNYIPSGYKEIKKGIVSPNPTISAASKPAPKAIDYPSQPPIGIKEMNVKKPSQLKNPSIIKSSIIASTPPAGASPSPKTLATITPPAPKTTPKRETNDQLDAAFDQLFKK